MADISQDLQKILDAIYGEEVRGSIHHAISLINDVSEVILTTGTAINAPTDSSEGYYTDSLYLNLDTYELWKCVGTNAWQSLGVLKGATGNGIDNIAKTATAGIVDTYTITYTDGTTDTFDITNGEDGDNGNRWYRGTAISGKAVLPTVYPTGIADANANDFYLNPSEGAIYHCVTGGNDQTATWSYDFTMTGGGGGGSIVTWTQTLLSGTKIAEIDIDGSTQNVYAPTGGGGTPSWGNITGTLSDQTDLQDALDEKADIADVPNSLDDLTDVTITGTPTQGETLIADANGVFKNQAMPQGGHTMLPTPSAGLTEAQVVTAINAATGANDNVPSLFGIQKWSNVYERSIEYTGTVNSTGIGTWQDDISSATQADEVSWGWWFNDAFKIPDNANNIKLDISYDPSTNEAITLGGWELDTSTGYLCIKFGNEIQDTTNAKIFVDLTYQRNDY